MGVEAIRIEDLPHYTYDDYVQWEGKWELIRGIPFAMTPSPRKRHQVISQRISWQLGNLLQYCSGCEVICTMDWPITDNTVVQPDIMIVCGDHRSDTKIEVTPVMIFEILSPSTFKKDRGLKYDLYRKAGVKYYCMVDPDANSVEVFVLQQDKYARSEPFAPGVMYFDLGPCRIHFDFSEVFNK